MIPKVPGKKPSPAQRELILVLAENLFPGKWGLGELKDQQRERWLRLTIDIVLGYSDLSAQVESLAEVLWTGVQVEIEDLLLKQDSFFQREEERAEAEAEEREERRAREDELHEQEKAFRGEKQGLTLRAGEQRIAQAEAREKNGAWIERILMAMMVVSFAMALWLLIGAASKISADPSSITGYLSLVGGGGGLGLFSLVTWRLSGMRRDRMELEPLPEGLLIAAEQPTSADEVPE